MIGEADKDGNYFIRVSPFMSKQITVNGEVKSLFKRVHGQKKEIAAGATENIDLFVPYPQVKFTGATIINTDYGDTVDFTVHDTANNTISGLDVGTYGANVELNKFGDTVYMKKDYYENTSNYDADLFGHDGGMIIRCSYTNNTTNTKTIYMNVELHEVK